MKRFVILTLAVVTLLAAAPAAVAQEEEEGGETSIVTEPEFEGEPPAVVIPPEVESAEDEPWTTRYLVPTLVVIGLLMLVGLGAAYYYGVKTKYKVVE